ncbi:MAG: GntR family transcriptional regulator [Xanthobacteraceae bacterium]|uniref:GntR family transcriptional regulator n=1 Tax=Pseudolabrys sp. TaxID=1960880 RepID=UPI003D1060F7
MAPRPSKPSENDRISSICDALRQAIIEQALRPGTKLPEDTVGERFGVGRTIARQALARLTAEGLVDHKRNRGAEVATPSWEEARDLFDLRLSLERLVVTRLAGHLTAEQIGILRQHIAKESTARNSREAISVHLATEFHTILAEMTGSPVLTRYVQEICRRCGLTLTLYARPHSSECAINEHMEIVESLAKGDVEAAIRIMHFHLEEVANRALISPVNVHTTSLMDVLAPYANGADDKPSGDEGKTEKAEASARAKPARRKDNPRKSGRH